MSGPNVISELECEWAQVSGDPLTAQVFADLQGAEPVLAELADLDDLVAVMAARSSVADLDRHDEILCALLRQAKVRSCAGDLAARITLQLLLPGLKSLCRHPYVAALNSDERRAALVAALWEEIRAPRSAWKPAKVSAQVIGRARGRLRPSRGAAARVSVVPFGNQVPPELAGGYPDASQEQSGHAGIELLRVLADAVCDGLLSHDQAGLVALIQVMGEPIEDIAAQLGVAPGAVARRLYRAQEALVIARGRPVPDAAAIAAGRRPAAAPGPVAK